MDMRLPPAVAAASQGVAEAPPPLRLLQRWQPLPSRLSAVPAPAPRLPSLWQRLVGR